jgi:uncharacterized protein YlxW (UPF0749 family)
MSLLTDLMDDAVRSDYGDPAAEPESAVTRRRWLVPALVVVAVLALILTMALVRARDTAAAADQERAALVARIEAATVANRALDDRIRVLREEVAAAESAAVADSVAGRDLAERAAALAEAAQYTTVSGPGLVVTLDDAEDAGADESDLGRVLDVDLQLVVNGLWRAGATAVAVNDHRLSSRTAIRSAGGAILVDYRPLRRPYVVTALAEPEAVRTAFEDGSAGRALRGLGDDYGIRWSLEAGTDLTLPPADSALPQFASVPEGAS